MLPVKADAERDAVAAAWAEAGGSVERLDRFGEPPSYLDRNGVRLYGHDTFWLVLAQKLNLELVNPDERILATAPDFLLRRRVEIQRLAALRGAQFPLFVKPVMPKQFRAAVYASFSELMAECRGLDEATEIILSDVVRFRAEMRAFALDSVIQTVSVYEGTANVDEGASFAESVLQTLELPQTSVLDVGLLDDGNWAFIEANPTWGAGLNGCKPEKAARCIAAATRPM